MNLRNDLTLEFLVKIKIDYVLYFPEKHTVNIFPLDAVIFMTCVSHQKWCMWAWDALKSFGINNKSHCLILILQGRFNNKKNNNNLPKICYYQQYINSTVYCLVELKDVQQKMHAFHLKCILALFQAPTQFKHYLKVFQKS